MKLVYWKVCKFKFEKNGRVAPKQIGNTYFHMQGAGLNVILKVYILHPGNMWNAG